MKKINKAKKYAFVYARFRKYDGWTKVEIVGEADNRFLVKFEDGMLTDYCKTSVFLNK
jgi:hypothetical protein